MEELKPCPVCHCEAEIITEDDWLEAVCNECGFTISRCSLDKLIEAWNRVAYEYEYEITHWMSLHEPPEMAREESGHWDGIAPEVER